MEPEVTAPKAYTEFTLHVDRIDYDHPVFDELAVVPRTQADYDNCKIAADYIAYQILGMLDENREKKRPDYWSEPEFEGFSPMDIELKIIRDQERNNYGFKTPYGRYTYQHALVLMKMIFPDTDITPVLADITQLFFTNFSYGRKYVHLLGSQDSGKSSTIARLVFLCMLIDVKHTFAPIASPFVNTSETIIWGDMLELFEEINTHHPLDDTNHVGNSLFPNSEATAGRIKFSKDGGGKAGWAAVRNLKKAGKLIGSKNIGSDPRKGIGLIAFDEINRAENTAFETELSNVAGQPWFMMLTAQNPRDEMDVGGMFAEPKIWKGFGSSSYEDIRTHAPSIWPTVKSGIAYRLNGLDSVNMRLGKVIYPYQFNQEKHQRLIDDYGETSPEYYSQCLAMFAGGDSNKRLLSQSRLSASKHDEEDFTMTRVRGKVMFCDPAHSGVGDKAVIGTALFGEGIVTNTDGSQSETALFVIRKPMEHVKFVNNIEWTGLPESNKFEKLYSDLGGDFNKITVGSKISYEQQITLRMAERAIDENIPYRNIGFDFSMRYEMVAAVSLIMGHEPVQYDYNTKSIGYYLESTKENTEEKCPQRQGRTYELGYLTADIFNSKQLRGGHLIPAAIIQTKKTKIMSDKPNDPFEGKKEYKATNENKSPDERDTLFGMVGMAFMRGFRATKTASPENSTNSIFKKSLKKKRWRSKQGKRL